MLKKLEEYIERMIISPELFLIQRALVEQGIESLSKISKMDSNVSAIRSNK